MNGYFGASLRQNCRTPSSIPLRVGLLSVILQDGTCVSDYGHSLAQDFR